MCNEIFIEEKFVWYVLMIGLLAFKFFIFELLICFKRSLGNFEIES